MKLFTNTLLTISFLAFSFAAKSQTSNWLWGRHAGGIFNEARGDDAIIDHAGNVIVSGAYSCPTMQFGAYTLVNGGGDDMYVVKYDPAGNVLWAKEAGDDYADEGYAVTTDGHGNVYVAGYFWSPTIIFGNTTLVNSGSADVFLVKYDANGNALWAKSGIGTDEDNGKGVAVDPSGNVYITGNFISDSIKFGNITLKNSKNGVEDIFLVKYDSAGNVVWGEHAVGKDKDVASDLAADQFGHIFLSGHYISSKITFGNVTLNSSGGYDMFIVKFDEAGNALWAKQGIANGYDFAQAVAADNEGNSYLGGHSSSTVINFGSIALNNLGGDDIMIAKYDSSGNVVWAHHAGGNFYDYCYGLGTDNTGNVYATGLYQSSDLYFDNDTLHNTTTSTYDFFIAKYDAAGNESWARNSDQADIVYGYGCAADDAGNLYVTGLFGNDTMKLDTVTLTTTTSGYIDMFLAKYSSVCANIFFADADNDNYGNAAESVIACTAPDGFVADSTDCNDSNPNVNPGALEVPNNGIDDDCDGIVDSVATIVCSPVKSLDFLLSPNPSKGVFKITFLKPLQLNITVIVTTVIGEKVFEQEIVSGASSHSFDFSRWEKGVYLVRVESETTVRDVRLVIQ